jgi:hypothetical protein
LEKILLKQKATKQALDQRKVLDLKGNPIDPNKPIIGGTQEFKSGIIKATKQKPTLATTKGISDKAFKDQHLSFRLNIAKNSREFNQDLANKIIKREIYKDFSDVQRKQFLDDLTSVLKEPLAGGGVAGLLGERTGFDIGGGIFSSTPDTAVKFNLDGETIFLNPDFFEAFMGPYMDDPEKFKRRTDDLKQEIRRNQSTVALAGGGIAGMLGERTRYESGRRATTAASSKRKASPTDWYTDKIIADNLGRIEDHMFLKYILPERNKRWLENITEEDMYGTYDEDRGYSGIVRGDFITKDGKRIEFPAPADKGIDVQGLLKFLEDEGSISRYYNVEDMKPFDKRFYWDDDKGFLRGVELKGGGIAGMLGEPTFQDEEHRVPLALGRGTEQAIQENKALEDNIDMREGIYELYKKRSDQWKEKRDEYHKSPGYHDDSPLYPETNWSLIEALENQGKGTPESTRNRDWIVFDDGTVYYPKLNEYYKQDGTQVEGPSKGAKPKEYSETLEMEAAQGGRVPLKKGKTPFKPPLPDENWMESWWKNLGPWEKISVFGWGLPFEKGGRVGMLWGGGVWKTIIQNLAKAKGVTPSDYLKITNWKTLPKEVRNLMSKADFEKMKQGRIEMFENWVELAKTRMNFLKNVKEGKKTSAAPIFEHLEKSFKSPVPGKVSQKDILQGEYILKNLKTKGRKLNAEGGLAGMLGE